MKSNSYKNFAWQNFWSERRGSNPLPSPWQGDALPDELLSHKLSVIGRASTANKTFASTNCMTHSSSTLSRTFALKQIL